MKKALLKSKNIIVFIHEDKKPQSDYNYSKVVVSKQPNSHYVFSASVTDLKLL
jgi:hypothetical protein